RRTSGCWATRYGATPACSPATRRWRRPGGSWTRCWTCPRPWSRTTPAAGARTRREAWWPASAGTIRVRKVARRAEASDILGAMMNANLKALRAVGQSLWLDNITRRMLDDGTLERWIAEYGLTGLTSNPTIFDEAIAGGGDYDAGIRAHHGTDLSGEALFVELALEDLRRAARLFEPAYEASNGVDGWVSMELSPLIADDTAASVDAARRIHAQAACRNLFVKIPGTPAGVDAIEESIFEGVPINVTLLFSMPQYAAAADAYMRGIERRIEAGRDPVVASVASVFISRWDKAIADTVPDALRNGLGIAMGMRSQQAYRDILDSDRW